MELNKKEKELLIRAFTFYYSHVRGDMAKKDNAEASNEDYKIRELTDKLGIRNMFSEEIMMGW